MLFSMYSCDWTDQSIQYKKLLHLTMIMNNSNNLNLQMTQRRKFDLEMFTSVCSYQLFICFVDLYYANLIFLR